MEYKLVFEGKNFMLTEIVDDGYIFKLCGSELKPSIRKLNKKFEIVWNYSIIDPTPRFVAQETLRNKFATSCSCSSWRGFHFPNFLN